jgi:hypothetical protein
MIAARDVRQRSINHYQLTLLTQIVISGTTSVIPQMVCSATVRTKTVHFIAHLLPLSDSSVLQKPS